MPKATPTVQEQIKKALDGRTQRWLILELGFREDTFSKKMKGIMPFNPTEIAAINKRLSSNIQL